MYNNEIQKKIKYIIENYKVVLFMKGTRDIPQCGFSSKVVIILNKLSCPFHDVNVLENDQIRVGIKKYSNWPTIPQLYIKGDFIGGCNIVNDLYQSNKLKTLL